MGEHARPFLRNLGVFLNGENLFILGMKLGGGRRTEPSQPNNQYGGVMVTSQ